MQVPPCERRPLLAEDRSPAGGDRTGAVVTEDAVEERPSPHGPGRAEDEERGAGEPRREPGRTAPAPAERRRAPDGDGAGEGVEHRAHAEPRERPRGERRAAGSREEAAREEERREVSTIHVARPREHLVRGEVQDERHERVRPGGGPGCAPDEQRGHALRRDGERLREPDREAGHAEDRRGDDEVERRVGEEEVAVGQLAGRHARRQVEVDVLVGLRRVDPGTFRRT